MQGVIEAVVHDAVTQKRQRSLIFTNDNDLEKKWDARDSLTAVEALDGGLILYFYASSIRARRDQ